MKFSDLKNALGISGSSLSNNRITITTGSLTPNIDTLIEYCFDNVSVVLDNSQLVSVDETNGIIVINSKSNFLNVSSLPLRATFSVDDKGNVQVFFKYSLLGSAPGPNDWRFSQSFPQLPKVTDNSKVGYFDRATQTLTTEKVTPLDALKLFNGYFIVVSNPQKEPDFKIDLKWGINFVSNLRPEGILGVIENLFQSTNQLTIYGTIRKPLPTETPSILAAQYPPSLITPQYPWDIADDFDKNIPGILLQTDLNLNYSIIKDKAGFSAEKLYFYTPINDVWVLENTDPLFKPVQAYTGCLEIVGQDVKIDMVSPFEIGIDEFLLLGKFKGFSLSNLAKLTGLTGSDTSPFEALPDQIKSAGNILGKLELVDASFSIDYSNLSDISVSFASFTVGMPDLKWKVWDNHFEIDSILCYFRIDNPLSTYTDEDYARKFTVTVYGKLEIENVPFNVYASNSDGYVVYAELAEKQTLPLKSIMETYAPGIPAPSDLSISTFRVGIAPMKAYSFALAMAAEPNPWIIPIGPTSLTVSDVSMNFTYPTGGSISGAVSGTISIGDFVKTSITYDIPGNIMIRSLFPKVTLNQIVGALTNQSLAVPDEFNLTFTNSSILMQKQGNNYIFQLATVIDNTNTVALQVQKVTNDWGVAFGVDMTSIRLSGLPGLSFLKAFEDIFPMDNLLMVVSSFDGPTFQFPDLTKFNNPVLATKGIKLPKQANTLVAGLNVYAQWHINTSDPKQQLLQKFLGLDPSLGITLQVGKNPEAFSKLFLSYNTQIQGHPFSCQFGGQVMDGSVGIFLTGSITVDIQGHPQTFDVTLLFVENGAFISATMKGQTAIDFEVFKLSNLALEIGINWEGIPSLGVAGTIDVSTFESSIAVFFDSAEPQKSLVAGAVSDLSLKDILDALTGNTIPSEIDSVLEKVAVKGTDSFQIAGSFANDLDNLNIQNIAAACQSAKGLVLPASQSQVLLVVNTPGQLWYLTDMTKMRHYAFKKEGDSITVSTEAQFYCAPQATSIGTLMFPQGFYISGAIEFFGFNASVKVDISTNRGIAIDAQMDKIVIGNETLFSITAEQGDGGPQVSVATFTQPEEEKPEFRPPHFYVNGQLEMLGLKKGVYINLTENGLQFDLNGDLIPGVHFDLNGYFDSLTNMDVSGDVKIGIGDIDLGPLGKISIDTGVEGKLEIGVKGDDIFARLNAGFEFAGTSHTLAQIDLDISTDVLVNLPSIVFNAVKKFLEELFTDPQKWAEWVAKGFIKGVDDVEKVLDDVFHLPPGTIKTIMNTFFPICALTSALGSMM